MWSEAGPEPRQWLLLAVVMSWVVVLSVPMAVDLRKCPLELAGYILTQTPLARYLRDGSLRVAPPGRSGKRVKVIPK